MSLDATNVGTHCFFFTEFLFELGLYSQAVQVHHIIAPIIIVADGNRLAALIALIFPANNRLQHDFAPQKQEVMQVGCRPAWCDNKKQPTHPQE